tara:strand:+ start:1587 stop:2582 length:996 start_codon:yes stop_codon:yes gene_type:complete
LNKIKSNLYNLLSIVLSILFIYGLVLIINDFDEIFSNISKLNIRVIFTASVVYFVSVYFRYLRWKLIYKELIGNYKFNMLKETIVGYMANNIFPFRLGELYRVKRISDKESEGFIKILSTVFTERFTDVLALLFFIILSIPFIRKFNTKIQFENNEINIFDIGISFLSYLVIFIILIIISFILYRLKLPYINKAILIITNFITSLTIFFNHKRELNKYSYLTILSIIIWLIEAIVYYVIAIEFLPYHNKYELIYIILIVCSITNLSGAIPSLPGNIGGFEFFGTITFIILGIASAAGASIIITVHLILFVPISIIGIIILILEKLNLIKNQ